MALASWVAAEKIKILVGDRSTWLFSHVRVAAIGNRDEPEHDGAVAEKWLIYSEQSFPWCNAPPAVEVIKPISPVSLFSWFFIIIH